MGKKRVGWLHCLDIPIIVNSVLSAFSLSLLFVIQPYVSLTLPPNCVRERPVSGVDKAIYTWVSPAYM